MAEEGVANGLHIVLPMAVLWVLIMLYGRENVRAREERQEEESTP
jgi:hypothetical protein